MTDTARPTPPGDEEPVAAASAPKWEGLIEEWTDCAKAAMDRVSERAEENVKLARAGKYSLGAYLDDVKWFWQGVAKDASKMVETVEDTTATSSRTGRQADGG